MLGYDKTPAPTYASVRSVPTSLSSPTLPAATMGKSISRPVQPVHRHLFIVTGPAGCGKSSVAQYLAKSQDFPYIEGDEFHPVSNVEKMAAGIPLNDGDRWDWLIVLREEAVRHLESGASGVVVTCSALKKKYRDVIRLASLNDHDVIVHFIYLRASEELLMSRVRARQNHYMKDSMVRSQFEALEEPTEKEQDVLTVDVSGTLADVEKLALEAVSQVMVNDSAPLWSRAYDSTTKATRNITNPHWPPNTFLLLTEALLIKHVSETGILAAFSKKYSAFWARVINCNDIPSPHGGEGS